ncbi:MAG: hypothetical protein HWE27_11935 [Gammaproteobacteria bacterium]|nr:hypothetical protein [Gammaproteobacteria bacterium]
MKRSKIFRLSLVSLLMISLPLEILASSEQHKSYNISIVVHKSNTLHSLEYEQVVDLFMGKRVSSPQGDLLTPIDIESGEALRAQFYNELTGLTLARVNAYWSRLKFTGRARPPIKVATSDDVLNYISVNPNAIGYLPDYSVTDDLRVVYTIDEQ